MKTMWACAALTLGSFAASAQASCEERPLEFRTDIRLPDAWELAWEAQWPDASSALSAWRADQFQALQSVWSQWAPQLGPLRAQCQALDLPESSAFLLLWSRADSPLTPGPLTGMDDSLRAMAELGMSPSEAMAWAHTQSGSAWSLSDWACAVRTGMRLMENMDLPEVHVVQTGETVYSIARQHRLPPACIAHKNNVWDDIRPGMSLLIPNLSP